MKRQKNLGEIFKLHTNNQKISKNWLGDLQEEGGGRQKNTMGAPNVPKSAMPAKLWLKETPLEAQTLRKFTKSDKKLTAKVPS